MKEKAIIIGASTTGKTTILKSLKNHLTVPVLESDDELISLNDGTYPTDSNHKLNNLSPKMVQKILSMKQILFLTNTHYFTVNDLMLARQKGFIIIQLSLGREIMEQRSKHRMEHQGYEDHTIYFDDMLSYQKEITDQGLIDKVIDTDRPVQDITREIINILKSPEIT